MDKRLGEDLNAIANEKQKPKKMPYVLFVEVYKYLEPSRVEVMSNQACQLIPRHQIDSVS